jgi:very-short-patch-repair endonuclease
VSIDAVIAGLAARQHGVVSRDQLTDAGIRAGAIDHRRRTGRLQLVHKGVYAVGYQSDSPLTRAMAAVLACGPGAVLSHRSAAALWEIRAWSAAVEVSAPSRHSHVGVVVHRARTLTRRDTTIHHGIPVTTIARTLIDVADTLDDAALARAVNEARVIHRIQLNELARRLAETRGRRGAHRLRSFVDSPAAPTRSALEDAFLSFTERHQLPRPEVNQRIAGYEVDMLWRSERLVAELDGRRFHDHLDGFERDRDKDANLMAAGYRVIRITWRRLDTDPEREARRLHALLAQPTSEPDRPADEAQRL